MGRQGTIGLYDPATSVFYLRDSNDTGYANRTFVYGPAGSGWKPIAGDWNGDGKDTIGLYDPAASFFYLRNSNDAGYADGTFMYGPAAAVGSRWPATGMAARRTPSACTPQHVHVLPAGQQ